MRLCRGAFLVLIVLLARPGTADAQWWAFIESLSGPGPAKPAEGVPNGLAVRLICPGVPGLNIGCVSGRATTPHVFEFRLTRATTGDTQRFDDDPTDVGAVKELWLDGAYMYRARQWIDVGVSAGVVRFSGDGFDSFVRPTFSPLSVAITPFGSSGDRWSRLLRIRFDEIVMPGIDGADFGNFATTYSTDTETIASVKLELDLLSLLR